MLSYDEQAHMMKMQVRKMGKTLDYYLTLPYTIELTPDQDGCWFAEIPLLKGCMTQGENREEALEMIDEAKILWLETALDEGIPIPELTPIKSL